MQAKRASARLIYTKERFASQGRTVVVTASIQGEGERLFAGKKSFGEPYACNQTTALALLTNSIRGRAARESENRRLIRQKRKRANPIVRICSFSGGVSEMKVELIIYIT